MVEYKKSINQNLSDSDCSFTLKEIKKIITIAKNDLEKVFDIVAKAGKEELSKKFKVICMIGVTGKGKSSTANSICG